MRQVVSNPLELLLWVAADCPAVIILTLDSICRPSLLSHIVTFQFIQHVKWFVCGRNFLLKTFDWNYAFSCNYIYAIFSIGTNTLLFSMFPVLWPNQFIIVQGRGQKKLGPTVMEDLTVRVLTPSLERPRAFSSNPWRWCCVSWAASRRHAAWHACVCDAVFCTLHTVQSYFQPDATSPASPGNGSLDH